MLNKGTYLFSRTFGIFANSLFSMTFIWWLQNGSHSSTLVGAAEGIFSLVAALSIFYGSVIDYLSFKKVSIYSVAIQTIILFLIFGTMSWFNKNYFLLIGLAVIISVSNNFFDPADRAILKDNVTSDEMTNLVSKVSIIDQGVNIAGTLVSGLLLSVFISQEIILFCGLISLLGYLLLVVSLKNVSSNSKEAKKANFKYIFKGYKFIRKNSFLNFYFWSSILYSFTTPAMVVLLPKVASDLHSNVLYSTFYACFIIGFIIGAIVASKLKPHAKVISITWMSSAIPLFVMLFSISNWIIFSISIFIFGILTSVHNILSESLIQIITVDTVLGRVLTTLKTSTSLGGPIGSVIAGILLDHSGEAAMIAGCAVLIFLSGLNIMRTKDIAVI
ncbi:MFS family permease [Lactobacillus colini]|uniref:MFS family permease n=1 Tax=Lactobacillus colini TaxID=1819254 RepID=A0ABS4MGA5_9LACO|nr:MFS transporter [Lactobacillus colini]MBP2058715.1 MFS family permease [Lactobacillus colini]